MEFAKFIQELTDSEEKFTVEVDEDNKETIVQVETASGGVVTFIFDNKGNTVGVTINNFEFRV